MEKESVFKINNVDLYIDKIFLEYEQPELFSLYNLLGNRFLAMLTASDALNDSWLVVPISNNKLASMAYGTCNIRDAFVTPELPEVYRITKTQKEMIVKTVLPSSIDENELPSEDAKLNWNNIPIPSFVNDVSQMANDRQHDIFDVHVVSANTDTHTMDIKVLSSLLNAINYAVGNIARAYYKAIGHLKNVLAECSLKFVGNYPGSFGMRLEGSEFSDLIGETKLSPVLAQLVKLLNQGGMDSLEQIVKGSPLEYTNALRKMLKFSCDNDAAVDFSYASPSYDYRGQASLDKDFSRRALEYLDTLIKDEEQEEEYVGELVSVSKKKNNFEFITDDEDEINGKIDISLKEVVFKVKCRAKIRVKHSIRITNSNDTEERYRLVGIEEIN